MNETAVVETDAGPVRGTVTEECLPFQGVPYAASTAGELPPWPPFGHAEPVPHVQSLAPGTDGIRPVDYAAEHKLDFWSSLL